MDYYFNTNEKEQNCISLMFEMTMILEKCSVSQVINFSNRYKCWSFSYTVNLITNPNHASLKRKRKLFKKTFILLIETKYSYFCNKKKLKKGSYWLIHQDFLKNRQKNSCLESWDFVEHKKMSINRMKNIF